MLRQTASAFAEDAFGNALATKVVQLASKTPAKASNADDWNDSISEEDWFAQQPQSTGEILLASNADYRNMGSAPSSTQSSQGGFFNLDGGGFDINADINAQMADINNTFDSLQKSLSVDQMGQPLYGPSHYDSYEQFGKIMSATDNDSFLTTAGKVWDWATYTVPDAQQHLAATYGVNPELARIDQLESSPIGAAFWLGAKLNGASPEAQQVWLDIGTIADSAAMFRTGTLGGAPSFLGAKSMPRLVNDSLPSMNAAEYDQIVRLDSKAGDLTDLKPISAREAYMGSTPDKYSRTGREVVDRMRSEGLIEGEGPLLRGNPNNLQLINSDGSKVVIGSNVDMAHKIDAVSWWNDIGRSYGAKAPEVRQFMLNSNNYVLQPSSINRSAGAQLNQTYQPPLAPEFLRPKK